MILEVLAAKDKRDFEYRLAKISAEKRRGMGDDCKGWRERAQCLTGGSARMPPREFIYGS